MDLNTCFTASSSTQQAAVPPPVVAANDWLTVLSDLRRSVSNLVLYVLECVPLAHPFPLGPSTDAPSIPQDMFPNGKFLPGATTTAVAAAPYPPPATLEEAIQGLVTQEPWTAPWLTTQGGPGAAAAADVATTSTAGPITPLPIPLPTPPSHQQQPAKKPVVRKKKATTTAATSANDVSNETPIYLH